MSGPIAWFARNGVAANLLMITILGMGLYSISFKIPLEVFPSIELDRISVRIPFRGATPDDVEEGVLRRAEEAIFDLQGIKTIRSSAREGVATLNIDVKKGQDERELLDAVKTRIDAITTFPDDVERASYEIAKRTREVISVVISGEISEREIRLLGEQVRDDLLALPGITQVEMEGARPYEISIEVAENTLRKYGLTLAQVAQAVRFGSLDLAAGSIRTSGGEILLRTKSQAYVADDFAGIVLLTTEDGTRLTVGDLATVKDGFEENPIDALFNGERAVVVEVYRVGDQSAIEVAEIVKAYIEESKSRTPDGVSLNYWRDRSVVVKKRLNTLLSSAWQGGLLIFLLLALFLRFSVAIWVCIGIPISFMGALAVMPVFGVTINIISLFAFILVLGVVVDDAIVTGENIYTHMRRGAKPIEAAIAGTHEVLTPVTFGILTTVAAFIPLFMVEGFRGKLFAQIPSIVVPVLLFSLVESKLILPAHLRHVDISKPDNLLVRLQQKIAIGLELAIIQLYQPVLGWILRNRYLGLAVFVGGSLIVFSQVFGGKVNYIFFPRVQSEVARAVLIMPPGTPYETTRKYVERIATAAKALKAKYREPGEHGSVIKDIMATSGTTGGAGAGVSYVGRVMFEIVSPEDRASEITSSQLVREWRRTIGVLPGAESLTFRAEIGRGGAPIDVQLAGKDFDALEAMSELIKERLRSYPGVFDVGDSFESGKQEIRLALKPQAELLGLTVEDLARQVRQAFFGEQAQRIQRGREDVRVMVRYPEGERRSLDNLESMRIRAPDGMQVPFSEVADLALGRGYAKIKRVDRSRVVNVTADINKETADSEGIKQDLVGYLDSMENQFSQIRYTLEGEAREQRESFDSLQAGMLFVLFAIYALLAIPFKSYVQPLIVMSVIPFGLVGAILGHATLGMNMSIMSIMGMLALSGVVVNDSLVLVDYVNRRVREGHSMIAAATMAGTARFRAVMLTSLTTFAGLVPLIFEKSTQAQFLIPMAVSLGFGILFATTITLLLVPVNYMILEDIKGLFLKAPTRSAAE